MSNESYRFWVNATAIAASAAFAGCNAFIGLSMGTYWISLEATVFVEEFWPQFTSFLYTVMPLFLMTLAGLVLSMRLDWKESRVRRRWLIAIGLFIGTSLITLAFHLPTNLRLRVASYSPEEASAVRSAWLVGHIPRVILALGIPFFALRAVLDRNREVERTSAKSE